MAGWWKKLKDAFDVPNVREYRTGWIFDGEDVVQDRLLCQSRDQSDQIQGSYLPASGSDWWYSGQARKSLHDGEIFETQEEALTDALSRLDSKIDGLQKIRSRLVRLVES